MSETFIEKRTQFNFTEKVKHLKHLPVKHKASFEISSDR